MIQNLLNLKLIVCCAYKFINITVLAILVGRMVFKVGCFEQLVNETIRVHPGHLHAASSLCTAVVSDVTANDHRLLVAPF